MKVLVIGSGGREHALCYKIAQSPLCKKILCLPGNPGIAEIAQCYEHYDINFENILEIIKNENINLVVIGSEVVLNTSIGDRLREIGISVFGPSLKASKIETSKSFAKKVMNEANVPTASYSVHTNSESAFKAAKSRNWKCVIKLDGLAGGKGVFICETQLEVEHILKNVFNLQPKIIVEDFLEGEEISVFAFCDGSKFVPMIASQDYKAALDNDLGPNTGGMGSYAPVSLNDDSLLQKISNDIFKPVLEQMERIGCPFSGLLYAGLIICDNKPYVLEFNARFGDPETQSLLPLLESDILPLLVACAQSNLIGNEQLIWNTKTSVCVVLTSRGYPSSYQVGFKINGLPKASLIQDILIFHAGTKKINTHIVTNGGRVLNVIALGDDLIEAREKAYSVAKLIKFNNKYFRTDIALKTIA